MVIKNKILNQFKEPGIEPNLIEESLKAPLESAEFKQSSTARNNLSRITTFIKIILDITCYIK
jgi:hypothetical protein